MEKENKIELRIYELLGIKFFRKLAFLTRDSLAFILTFWWKKEKRQQWLYDKGSNYIIRKEGNMLENFKEFKTSLLFNAIIHIICILVIMPKIINMICLGTSLLSIIDLSIYIIINLYCIMLQRYNQIKINNIIKKLEVREEKKKQVIIDEIEKDYDLTKVECNLVDKNYKKYKIITSDEAFEITTLEQLKMCRDFLENTTHCKYTYINLENGKKLKLEKDKKHNF